VIPPFGVLALGSPADADVVFDGTWGTSARWA
jgi:hypothetical protein